MAKYGNQGTQITFNEDEEGALFRRINKGFNDSSRSSKRFLYF